MPTFLDITTACIDIQGQFYVLYHKSTFIAHIRAFAASRLMLCSDDLPKEQFLLAAGIPNLTMCETCYRLYLLEMMAK